jgi:hypothetical protein
LRHDSTRQLAAWWGFFVALQSVLAILCVIHSSSLGYTGKLRLDSDVRLYFGYARPLLEGLLPYRDYPLEYPILAIPLFVVPMAYGTDFASYLQAFVAQMLLFNAATVWIVAREVERSEGIERVAGRLAWYTCFFVALCPMIVVRYDLVPTFLGFAAVTSLARGRTVVGALLAGLGILVKLVPGLVILPFLATRTEAKSKAVLLATVLSVVGVGALGWWLVGGERMLGSIRYHGERGLEIGSLYSSAYLVAHKMAGILVFPHFDHGSLNISGAGSRDAARLSTILQAAFLLLVVGRAWQDGPGHEIRHGTAALLAYTVAGKVLSPQYLVWLIPFVCVLNGPGGRVARVVFLVCCVLTTLIYPRFFNSLQHLDDGAILILVARNLSLAGLFALVLWSPAITPTRSSPEACS